MDLDERRKLWNEKHKELTEIIGKPKEHERAVELFLSQHALLYASRMGVPGDPAFEDDLLEGLEEQVFRSYPVAGADSRNSIAWHLWHIARIEDATMNLLVAGQEQVYQDGGWQDRLGIRFADTGNGMTEAEIGELSSEIHLASLLEYREAVGRRTRQVIGALPPGAFKEKVRPERIRRLFAEGAVTEEAGWLADYWSRKTVGGLILMPATRHNFVHLNKSMRIKGRHT